ncbi:MAG: histidine kinase [Chitinophagaceae bacterium]|nr:histidine kinase [Chitinophagaceae bacterium]MCW5927805.1 histidine kinase [Chitinophagaceae bacterium]
MKFHKPPTYEFHGFLISMPLIGWYVHYILYGDRIYHDPQLWFVSFPILFALAVVSWYMHSQYHTRITLRFPGLRLTAKRILFKLFVYPLVMVPSVVIIHAIYAHFHLFGYNYSQQALKLWLLQGIVVNLVFETLWEVVYIIQQYKENLTEKELLQQMKTEQEFENLKAQVNPHFLFNCFNTLSGLISEDKIRADQFLNELSKVYRYLLNANQNDLTTLNNEIKFIQSFLELLKTRYGSALQVGIRVDESYFSFLLPTLSLQLLVENAVKHNVVSKKEPLLIELYTENEPFLVVKNTLQLKQVEEASTGIGLKNIQAKYLLLNETRFEAGRQDGSYVVKLPLIKEK